MHSAANYETEYLIQKLITYVKTFVQSMLEHMLHSEFCPYIDFHRYILFATRLNIPDKLWADFGLRIWNWGLGI